MRSVTATCDTPEGLHRARKAAKRARYVVEFTGPAVGKPAAALGRRAKHLQEQLGEHQDSAVAADFLARVAVDAPAAVAFGCGVLWAHAYRRSGARST